ncbi:SMP-30/gluconolactonase/LRE family protein [Antrihabitans cavernicola]|uniref:SMP-30/gluconolactonase/LRE family protein n=1 Tax=Antrihabitans cavernicola TaxID=2495913 RepID=A0A5A7SDP1_9NOCA|nr:SMP-30/gluconolactonase/LRE family protein [Spelaeibacter cavernicola]KAA0022595.1 SMP-30/gluconolactonase/LRE family protein [Spelaeibacter cavernicola]
MFGAAIRRTIGAGAVAVLAATTFSVLAAPQAAAAPVCPGAGQAPVLVGSVPGAVLEGVTVDPAGRLYTTDAAAGRIFRIDAPGARPVQVASVPTGNSAGALAWQPDGSLIVGYSGPSVLVGDVARPGTLARVDVNTGAVTPFASGLSAANGVAVAKDGSIYATNDFGNLVGRVAPNGAVQPNWSSIPSANGAALTSDGAYLYVAQTFANPGISRIPIANPGAPENVVSFGGGDVLKAADGLTLDSRNRPIVPTDVSGEILRVDGPGQVCTLASGLFVSSVVTYGRGTGGFSAGRLFRAGFDGNIYEIPGGFDPAARTAAP